MTDLLPSVPNPQDIEAQRDTELSLTTALRLLTAPTRLFLTSLRAETRSQVQGPLDDVLRKGAERYNAEPDAFLRDFDAMKSNWDRRLYLIFDLIVRLPHTATGANGRDGITSLWNFYIWRLTSIKVDSEPFGPCPGLTMYDWLDLLRRKMIDLPSDSFTVW